MMVDLADQPSGYRPLYDLEEPVRAKIERIAKRMYGAEGVE
jgi:formyltetrahydrofolate synthetase